MKCKVCEGVMKRNETEQHDCSKLAIQKVLQM